MTTAPHADRSTRREAAGVVGGLFECHGRMVYGVCRAMLRDAHEAEDATQQSFLSAFQALLGGASVREPGAWLATIARNECRARIADGMRRPLPVADEDLDDLPDERDEHARRLRVEELRAALAGLPDRQREAVVLRYLYGLRYGEVATALGLSRPATEALLFRARRSMRVRLRPAVGAVLVVPSVVRDELALALPGFGDGSGGEAAAAGLAGGLLVKLAGGSIGLKAATAAVAVSTVGIVGAMPTERVDRITEPDAVALDGREGASGAALRSRGLGSDGEQGVGPEGTTLPESSGSTDEGEGGSDDRVGSGGSGASGGVDGRSERSGGTRSSSDPSGTDDGGEAVPASVPASAPMDDEPDEEGGGSKGGSDSSGPGDGTEIAQSHDLRIQAEPESSSGTSSSGSGSSGGGESSSGSSGSGSGGSGSEEPGD